MLGLICSILVVTQEIRYMVRNWDFKIRNPFACKWTNGCFGQGYSKMSILRFVRFNVELIKLPEGSYIKPHFDAPYRSYREFPYRTYHHVKMNFNLQNSEGGDFICQGSHINNRFLAIYEPDRHEHSFEEVSKGTKFILSLGVLI